uniref:DNA-binding protein n=1 Tax=candidate division WOR-3 bacterium TaxID=2052148 RepID=A0A7V3RH52_UNCW3
MKLIDIQTLSALLSVKTKTIYDWVHKAYIPYIKVGRLIRFDENEIKQWLEKKRVNKSSGKFSI